MITLQPRYLTAGLSLRSNCTTEPVFLPLHSVSWGWSPGEKQRLLYQPNTNIDKIELNRISKNRIWSDVDWRYHPIWSSLKRSVIKTYIPVVYWFMFDEHFLVWLDILFIYGSRDIKFLNMKWEKNIRDVKNCTTLTWLSLKINLEEYNG